jgi:hypothetical protein
MYIVSITSIILLITKGYSASVRIIYKRTSRVRDITALRLPRVTRGIASLYKTLPNLY